MQAMREKVVMHLEYYIVYPKQHNWQAFKEVLAVYLKSVTGALCASAETLSDFQAIAELNGYKPGWAYFRFQQKNQHVRN